MTNTMSFQILSVFTNALCKISIILSTVWGWLTTIMITLFIYIAPIQTMLITLLIIILIDLALGMWINRHSLQSSKLRQTVIKAFFYMIVIILAFSIELSLGILVLAPIIFSLCALTELISVIANMSIICPGVRVFVLVRKALRTEIANKTGLAPEEVDKVLSEKDSKKVCTKKHIPKI